MITNRQIVHIDLDTFFVSVERLINPKLKGKPVIIGGSGDRSVVASCSYEARQYGIRSAMPIKLARTLCADAIFIKGDIELYSKYSCIVTDIIADMAPVYEKVSIDEHYIDITGMDKYINGIRWIQQLKQRIIKETGLPLSLGISINKSVSKIATGLAKPNGEKNVPASEVISFLKPLPIRVIPGVGEKTHRLLTTMGIETVGILQQMPTELLVQVLGKNGYTLWEIANGIDTTPVKPYTEQQSISTEQTFEQDTTDIKFVHNTLIKMIELLTYELRQNRKLTGCITVKIRYSNFDTHTLQKKIPYTNFDHKLIPEIISLFTRLYHRRMLIRLIGLKFSDLIQGSIQLNLFENVNEWAKLYSAIDNIRNQYGINKLRRAIYLL